MPATAEVIFAERAVVQFLPTVKIIVLPWPVTAVEVGLPAAQIKVSADEFHVGSYVMELVALVLVGALPTFVTV